MTGSKCPHAQIELRDIPTQGNEPKRRAWLCKSGCGTEFMVETEEVKSLDVENAGLRDQIEDLKETIEERGQLEAMSISCVHHGDKVAYRQECLECFEQKGEIARVQADIDNQVLNLYSTALRNSEPEVCEKIDSLVENLRSLMKTCMGGKSE